MISPVDPKARLQRDTLEQDLVAYRCPTSGGYWVKLDDYWRWHDNLQAQPAAHAEESPTVAEEESRGALLCPESGALLIRFRVGKGLAFSIDRSPVTGGVWLDAGEWQALKSQDLHAQMHHVFTASYQDRQRSSEFEARLDAQFAERLGDDVYARAKEFCAWMKAQDNARAILCYLQDEFRDQ